jgi:hypothetical protein
MHVCMKKRIRDNRFPPKSLVGFKSKAPECKAGNGLEHESTYLFLILLLFFGITWLALAIQSSSLDYFLGGFAIAIVLVYFIVNAVRALMKA